MKKRRLLYVLYCAFCCLLLNLNAWAQQTVRGTLRGQTGEPLAGATVTVKGTTTTAISDAQGRFTINAASGSTLVVTSVGFQPREISVTGGDINEVMQVSEGTLNEVVVIGYQSVRKKDLTGATSVVNPQNTQRLASRSLPEQLQGMAAGVAVRTGGAPGQEAVVNIRGLSTVFGNGNPLYIIDGTFSDPNTTVNPNDIESIQVLKDASAAAIYGSRAGNGVIIITTKKGREGPAKINFSARYGVQQIPKKWEVMDAPQFLKTVQQQYQNSGVALPAGFAAQLANNTINTDWQEEVFRTGQVQDYNVGISGGSQTANFLVSAGYYKNKGVLIANEFNRASLRINSEARKGRFSFGENLFLSNSNGENPGGGVNAFYESALSLPIIAVQGPQYSGIPANPAGWGMGTSDVPSYA